MGTTKLDVNNEHSSLSRPSDHYENGSFLKLMKALHGYKLSGGIQKTLNAEHSLSLP